MISIVSSAGTEHVIIDEYRYGKCDKHTLDDNFKNCFEAWKCLLETCPGLVSIDLDRKLTEYESRLITEHNHQPTSVEFEIQNGTFKLYRKRRTLESAVPNSASTQFAIPTQPEANSNEDCENIVVESSDLEQLLHEINQTSNSTNNNDANRFSSPLQQPPLPDSEIQFVTSRKGHLNLLHNGFHYRKAIDQRQSTMENNVNDSNTTDGIWRCTRADCNGRVKIYNGTFDSTYSPSPHNHQFDDKTLEESSQSSSDVIPLLTQPSSSDSVVRFIQTPKGYVHLLYDGYRYRRSIDPRQSGPNSRIMHNTSNANGIWRCTRRDCNGRVKLHNGTVVPRINSGQHSHSPVFSGNLDKVTLSSSRRLLPVMTFTSEFVNNKQYILVDGYRYRFGYTLWRCTEKHCTGSMKVNHSGDRRQILTEHFHRPNFRQGLDDQISNDDDQVDDDFPPPQPISDAKFVESVKGKTNLVYDGYRYRKYKKLPGDPDLSDSRNGNWRCTRRNCRGRVKFCNGMVVPTFKPSLHNHPPNQFGDDKTGHNPSGNPFSTSSALPALNFIDEKIEFVDSIDGIPQIVVDKYRYRFGRQLSEGYTFWKCPENYCKGSMKINITGDQRQILSEHFHLPNQTHGENGGGQLPQPIFASAKFIQSIKGKPNLIYAGYRYHRTKKMSCSDSSGDKLGDTDKSVTNGNWSCVRAKCKGRVKVFNGAVVPTLNPAPHTHLPEHLDYHDISSVVQPTMTFTDQAIQVVNSVDQGKPQIIVDGYRYRFGRLLAHGYTYWLCLEKDCTGSININIAGDQREILSEHFHLPNQQQQLNTMINHSDAGSDCQNDLSAQLAACSAPSPPPPASQVKFIRSTQGNIHLTYDGYRYRVYTKLAATEFPTMENENNVNDGVWRCVRNRCRARINLENGTVFPTMNSEPHTHAPEYFEHDDPTETSVSRSSYSRGRPVLRFTDQAIKLVESVKGKPNIFLDGYRYRLGGQLASGSTYWRCSEKDCKGSMKINTSGDERQILCEHHHLPNPEPKIPKKYLNELKRKEMEQESEGTEELKQIKLDQVPGPHSINAPQPPPPPNQEMHIPPLPPPPLPFGYYTPSNNNNDNNQINQSCTTTIDFANANYMQYN